MSLPVSSFPVSSLRDLKQTGHWERYFLPADLFNDIHISLTSDPDCARVLNAGLMLPIRKGRSAKIREAAFSGPRVYGRTKRRTISPTHVIALERVGPATDGHCRTMRGRDISELMLPAARIFAPTAFAPDHPISIGIGDGGNEIGMGRFRTRRSSKTSPTAT